MQKFTVKALVATAIGIALFFVLAKISIPSGIPNTNISLQYGVLTAFATLFGPLTGALIGFAGHALNDFTAGWGVWWSWVIASCVQGLLMGLVCKLVNAESGNLTKKAIITFIIGCIVSNAVSWLVVAPLGDVLIYAEDASYVFTQGAVAFAANTVVSIVVGGLLVFGYTKTLAKPESLDKE